MRRSKLKPLLAWPAAFVAVACCLYFGSRAVRTRWTASHAGLGPVARLQAANQTGDPRVARRRDAAATIATVRLGDSPGSAAVRTARSGGLSIAEVPDVAAKAPSNLAMVNLARDGIPPKEDSAPKRSKSLQIETASLGTSVDDRQPGGDRTPRVPMIASAELLRSATPEATLPPVSVTALSGVRRELPPPIEEERAQREKRLPPEQDTVTIVSGFECSAPMTVTKQSPTHFSLQFSGLRGAFDNYFLFRIEGARGKTVRIDIDDAPISRWWSLNPVYSDVADLGDPESFKSKTADQTGKLVAAYNGPLLPDTAGEQWHFIANVWTEQTNWKGPPNALKTPGGRFSMVHQFDTDRVFVALKAPYTQTFNRQLIRGIADNPLAKVIEVGRSEADQPLSLIKIGGDEAADKSRPCILIYAKEHGTEQDASWAVEGAVQYLLGDSKQAIDIRNRYTVLLLPVMDPDGAAASFYDRIDCGFMNTTKTVETIAYANWVQAWIDRHNRLDVVLNLHNVESAEAQHVACALAETLGERGWCSDALNATIDRALSSAGYDIEPRPRRRGWSPARLGGWISRRYGALTIAYELNSQAPRRHLLPTEARRLGVALLEGTAAFLASTDGPRLLSEVDQKRRAHDERWQNIDRQSMANWDAIAMEATVSRGVGIQNSKGTATVETWVP